MQAPESVLGNRFTLSCALLSFRHPHIFAQFALNEISFFLTRFLQSFSSVSLASDAQPRHSHPPTDWAKAAGRKSIEKIMAKSHLTIYAFVSPY
jgi:hypothetical protein